jgi:aminoglycoside phosphotransferase (APT) family kinase protein
LVLVGLIDFDLARPGPRLRDVAYGVYWFAPLSFSSDLTALACADMQNNAHRLKLFCHSYGIEPTAALLDMRERLAFHQQRPAIEAAIIG